MRDELLTALAGAMGLDPTLLGRPGVSVLPDPGRAENQVTAGYQLDQRFVVTCDPAAEALLIDATADMAPTLAAWEQVAAAAGGELLGTGRMQVLTGALEPTDQLPSGYAFRSLSRSDDDDLALIARLIEAADEDDLDAAEIEIDDLDETIEVIVDAAGEIASYSAGRPFDMAEQFGDIGIMTMPAHRGIGLGSILVAALCPRLRQAGLEPLYRCDEDNTGSVKLSAGLGFEIVTQLSAYRFTPPVS